MQNIKKLFKNLLMKDRQQTNLKEVLSHTIKYEPIPFNFNNVGTYKR